MGKMKKILAAGVVCYVAYKLGQKYLKENNYGTLSTLDPHSCYEESKRMGETICNAYHTQYNLPTKIARIFHAYAPTMNINDPRVFSSFTRDVINNQDIQMKSEGLAKRSFCYITDIITGFLTILLKGKPGEPYNLCNTDQFISIIELAEIMVNIFPEGINPETYGWIWMPDDTMYCFKCHPKGDEE